MTHQSPKVHRDPPSRPQPWLDPDPLTVEPETVDERVPWHGWELEPERPISAGCAWFGLGVCVGTIVLALVIVAGRAFDATPSSGQTTDRIDLSPASSAALSGAPHGPGPAAEGPRSLAGIGGAPLARSEGPVPSPTGEILTAEVYRASATYCEPTPTQCQGWGGDAKLAAVNSFTWGDRPYWVRVSRGDAQVDVLVVSHCACFGQDGYIDLSLSAFLELAPKHLGRVDVVVETLQVSVETTLPPTDVPDQHPEDPPEHPEDERMRLEDRDR